ncbi:MAG: DUF7668 domain-containing protein [Gaiellaceae bacterium]
MLIPESIAVRCLVGREPFPGTWVALALECAEEGTKTALSFAFGPTREDGRLFLRREDVLAQARYFDEGVGLDYANVEERWNGRGWLSSAGAPELRHQLKLTFADPPLRQASTHRVAAARALRYLNEHEGERLSIKIESELPKNVTLDPANPGRGDWLPDWLYEPVQELLTRVARRDLPGLIEEGVLGPETAAQIEREIIDYGASPVIPPDIALLLTSAVADGEDAWTIEAPLWTREEGPSDLTLWIHARELETGLELTLRGIALV